MKIEINNNLAIVLIAAMVFGMIMFLNYSGSNIKSGEDSTTIGLVKTR